MQLVVGEVPGFLNVLANLLAHGHPVLGLLHPGRIHPLALQLPQGVAVQVVVDVVRAVHVGGQHLTLKVEAARWAVAEPGVVGAPQPQHPQPGALHEVRILRRHRNDPEAGHVEVAVAVHARVLRHHLGDGPVAVLAVGVDGAVVGAHGIGTFITGVLGQVPAVLKIRALQRGFAHLQHPHLSALCALVHILRGDSAAQHSEPDQTSKASHG
mmetsp:Transcript_121098/g.287700  ORF Transcript_121098/g.287700 Transcript_121098/m.287700 type:complete len:212 (-) Transcript_121098:32-667(-)|eukprot:CAMPEP_0181453356 /NCGR_PEP_ID=MMETSP1110-20121109/29683_1 /TAXON_ID=174948 /ORGANISM="Symbiodinium sp., Strain CCMP421" /LENGTH=211 /DNA_ID=CAMNT_0023577673 /DNA_START=332 /DNA_END=967 /DNA_ORIENTATION=-